MFLKKKEWIWRFPNVSPISLRALVATPLGPEITYSGPFFFGTYQINLVHAYHPERLSSCKLSVGGLEYFIIFCIFLYIGKHIPNWLIFFRGVETTNQMLLDVDSQFMLAKLSHLLGGYPVSPPKLADAMRRLGPLLLASLASTVNAANVSHGAPRLWSLD